MNILNTLIFAIFTTQDCLGQRLANTNSGNPFLTREQLSSGNSGYSLQSNLNTIDARCLFANPDNISFQLQVEAEIKKYNVNIKYSNEIYKAAKESGFNSTKFMNNLKDGIGGISNAQLSGAYIRFNLCNNDLDAIAILVRGWNDQITLSKFNNYKFGVTKGTTFWNLFLAKSFPIPYINSDVECQINRENELEKFDEIKAVVLFNKKRSQGGSKDLVYDKRVKELPKYFENQDEYLTYKQFSGSYPEKGLNSNYTFCDGLPRSYYFVLKSICDYYPSELNDSKYTNIDIIRNGFEWKFILGVRDASFPFPQ